VLLRVLSFAAAWGRAHVLERVGGGVLGRGSAAAATTAAATADTTATGGDGSCGEER
jgi:hypothetical protein